MLEAIIATVFGEVSVLLVLAAGVGFLGLLLRQPLVVSFIAAGIIAGPSVLDLVRSSEQIELLSQLGVAILLFFVGIKLDVGLIRSLGPVAISTGLGQVGFTSLFGAFIALALGFNVVESLYIAVALTFSSTIIIVKLLSDKGEIDSLHGQIALGFLIVQDLVVVFAMAVLSALGVASVESADSGTTAALLAIGSAVAFLAAVVVFIRFVANPLTERLARSPELLITFAIAHAAIFAAIGDAIGLGKELGGLVAGVSLASTPYREAISSRMAPLRDFLLLFFFIALGAKLDLSLLGAHLTAAVVFSLFVLIGNPLIVLAIMGVMGYRKRTGFLAGLTVAQISEFSLIFIAMGVSLGHVGPDALGLVTLVGLITIAASTYMITYSHQLFALCEPLLWPFERRGAPREARENLEIGGPQAAEVVLLGLGRFGTAIALRLQASGTRVLGVDFNPEAVRRLRARGMPAIYGDATDPEFIAGLPLGPARWVVSTVPVHGASLTEDDHCRAILLGLRAAGYTGRIALTSHRSLEVEGLLKAGAHVVFEPYLDAADRAVEIIQGDALQPRLDVDDARAGEAELPPP